MLFSSMKFKCCRRWIQFTRWSRFIRAEPGALEYRCKLSFEGLPNQSWTTVSVKAVLKDLGGELIEILPPTNRHELEVMAWLRDPFYVGKLVTVEIPDPKLINKSTESMDDMKECNLNWVTTDHHRRGRRKRYCIQFCVV